MPLSLDEQYRTAMNSFTEGDFDLFAKLLTNPEAVTLMEQRTVAERLGLKRGFLSFAVNTVSDPMVWLTMLLARKFPTAQWIRGTIPHRFIGAANEFSGLSVAARPVEAFFRGTNIPKLVALKMQREAEVMKIGTKIFDEISTRPQWEAEMPIVSMILEGQNPAGASQDLHNVARRIRTHMNELWDNFLSKTVRVEGGFQGDALTLAAARPFRPEEAPRFLRDYLPHIPLLGPESTVEISASQALQRMGRGKSAQLLEAAGESPADVWQVVRGSDRLQSSYTRYMDFMNKVGAQFFNPRLFRRVRNLPLSSLQGQEVYVTDLNIILQKYIHSVARTYANNAPLSEVERALASTSIETAAGNVTRIQPTADPVIVQIINEGLAAASPGGAPQLRRQQVLGTRRFVEALTPGTLNAPTVKALNNLVRAVQGLKGEDEILYGNVFNSIRKNTLDTISGAIGKRRENQLEDAISTIERSRTGQELKNATLSYLYSTTLGLNPLSWIKNLFQPVLTTAPAIGIGPTVAGYKVLQQRLPQYFRQFHVERQALAGSNIPFPERMTLSLERSFSKIFPELAETGIRADPRLFELSEAEIAQDLVRGTSKFRNFDSFNRFMMQPFVQTETANQIVTFYGGKEALRQALRRGELDVPSTPSGGLLPATELERFLNFEAASMVSATQFKPGPGSKTILQSMIPAPLRMFSSFPIRLANFFAESTVRGALTAKQLETAGIMERLFQGRNFGTVARSLLYGRIANEGLRQVLGVDMADALGFGPFNFDPAERKFFPIPIAPLPSVVAGVASFATTRDIKRLQPLTLPLIGDVPIPKVLLPGGIAITRATRAVQQFRPDLGGFADDEERLMFRGTTPDLILSMLGIPLDKERRMRRDLDILSNNRLQIRQLRREFALGFINNDFERINQASRQYTESFPEMAQIAPLSTSTVDINRYERNRRMTSIQRFLQSMGEPGSYMFTNWIQQNDPLLLGLVE